jgi:hypothetical protein
MSPTLEAIRRLVAAGEVRISEHGYDELSEDAIRIREVMDGVGLAIEVEDYPAFPKGTAVLITAYRPDPARWNEKFTERRK